MAKRRRPMTGRAIEKRLKEGRGTGAGTAYKPWRRIQDGPSLGLVSRDTSWKTERVHHTMSNLEHKYFLILDWSEYVVDHNEQFLLPLEETVAIAQAGSLHHPADPITKEPTVMTTDFVVTVVAMGGERRRLARAVNPVGGLHKQPVLERLEIERRYWAGQGIDWGIVTEREVPEALVKNIAWVHKVKSLDGFLPLSSAEIADVALVLTKRVQEGTQSLAQSARLCDDRLGHEPGTGLIVARHLIATRQWTVDMTVRINPSRPLVLSATALWDANHEAGEEVTA